MSTVKRTLVNVSFYDPEAIQRKLEQMAAQGWMIQKAGNLFWTYTKIPPQKLRFAVTYFPGASEFDPKPSEKQLEKEELCAQDGWRLVLRWDVMQIFCTDREDAVPIDTDPVPQVDNIHRTMRKKVLVSQLVMALSVLGFLYLQLSQLWRDPADYLSDNSRLFTIPLWLMLLLMTIYELVIYFRWGRRAKEAAEHGVFLPVRAHPWLSWAAAGLAIVFLLLSFSASSGGFLFLLVCAGLLFLLVTLNQELRSENFTPLFYHGTEQMIQGTLLFLSRSTFYLVLPLLLPRTVGTLRRSLEK